MEVETPYCGVGRCLYLAKADLILKFEFNVNIYKWGYYLDQHAIRILFTNGVSNMILTNGIIPIKVII